MEKQNRILNFCVFLFLTLIQYSNSYSALPSSITPCKSTASDFNVCFLSESRKFRDEFIKGLPEFGVPVLDPLIIENTEFSTGNGFSMKNKLTVLKGLGAGKIDDIKIDLRKKKVSLTYTADLDSKSSYEVSGHILNFPINGTGNLGVKIQKFKAKVFFTYTLLKDEQGTEFSKIKLSKKDISIGNAMFKLDGLFSKEFGETMTRLLNENWRDIMLEVGGPAMEVVVQKTAEHINNFLSKVPYNELFPE